MYSTFRGPRIVNIFLWYVSNKMQLYTVYLFLENCSTCFGWYIHPSSGAHTTVFTVYGTYQTVTATCRYCGTGLSEVWELYFFGTVADLSTSVSNSTKTIQFPHHTQTSSTVAAGSSKGLTSTRYCKYSCVCS
jgi:hypothetical protein